MRMPYAYAYVIRITGQTVARSRPRRCRRRVPGLLAAALLHRRHAGARHVRLALPVAGGACDVRKRGDGDGGGADLARPARAETRSAPVDRADLRVHGGFWRGVRALYAVLRGWVGCFFLYVVFSGGGWGVVGGAPTPFGPFLAVSNVFL